MAESVPPSSSKRRAAAVGAFITGLPGTLTAIATGLGAILAVVQTYQDNQATARASYEALKASTEQQAAQIAQLHQGQLELRAWVQEQGQRLERQQATVAEAVRPVRVRPRPAPGQPATTTVEKPVTVVAPAVAPEPLPPAPVLAPAPAAAPLPSFEALK